MTDHHIKAIHNKIDEFTKKEPNVCKKGCSYCCFQLIEIMDVEVGNITTQINSLSQEIKDEVKNNLSNWLDNFNINTPNRLLDGNDVFRDFAIKSPKLPLKCPFLIDNSCSIYENRPITCRVHIVDNNPLLCDENRQRDSLPKAFQVRYQVTNYIKQNTKELTIIPLPYLASKILLPERPLKEISKVVLPK